MQDKPLDPNRCKEPSVSEGGSFPRYHQCRHKPKRDGWCAVHHPDAVAERERKRDAKFADWKWNTPSERLFRATEKLKIASKKLRELGETGTLLRMEQIDKRP